MSTEPEVNIPLLRKAVEWAEFQSALPMIDCQWDQAFFIIKPQDRVDDLLSEFPNLDEQHEAVVATHCGTAYCIAGYVGQLLNPGYEQHDVVNGVHVAEFARDHLGLNEEDAEWLWEGSHTIEEVRSVAETIAGQKL